VSGSSRTDGVVGRVLRTRLNANAGSEGPGIHSTGPGLHDTPGPHVAGAVVARDGTLVDIGWTPTAEIEPAFLAYSITKTFVATLFLQWQDEGVVSLEESLARWMPSVPSADRISLRHLLNHTSGLPDYGPLPAYHEAVRTSPSQAWTFERYASETYERGLLADPGHAFAYSNPGYMLLKRIAEQIGGRVFDAVISDRITLPLGLARTFVVDSRKQLAELAPASSRFLTVDGSIADTRALYDPGWVSHGVIASTPSDVALFFSALFGGRLISGSALAEMTTLVAVDADVAEGWLRPGYGLGLMGSLTESPWGPLFGHNGGGPGYSASAWHAVRTGLSVCVMTAIEEGHLDAQEAAQAILDEMRM
jgi:D-alanyl-D-alanine carboxypeptidase